MFSMTLDYKIERHKVTTHQIIGDAKWHVETMDNPENGFAIWPILLSNMMVQKKNLKRMILNEPLPSS